MSDVKAGIWRVVRENSAFAHAAAAQAGGHIVRENGAFTRTGGSRIAIPRARVRLSAGRREMTEEAQALCFLAGANSLFVGDELLTTPNPELDTDAALFAKLGVYGSANASK